MFTCKYSKSQLESVLVYSFLFGYVLSFIFQGHVFFEMVAYLDIKPGYLPLIAMFLHMLGLISAGILEKLGYKEQTVMTIAFHVCILTTGFFVIPSIVISVIVLGICSFFSGMAVGTWGGMYKRYINTQNRLKAMASALIFSNILMIAASVVAVYISAVASLFLSIGYLAIGLIICKKRYREDATDNQNIQNQKIIEKIANKKLEHTKNKKVSERNFWKPLSLLFIFIGVITIDSGLMYSVINTTYDKFSWLTAWYWAIPYIAALLIMRFMSSGKSRNSYIYLAIWMIAVAFILFTILAVKPVSYVIIDTFLLSAAGILDLFWASIIGETLDYTEQPVKVLSIGWSANVFGVFLGGIIGQEILRTETSRSGVAIIALIIICISLMIVPVMIQYFRVMLKDNIYIAKMVQTVEHNENEISYAVDNQINLTSREKDVLSLVLTGKSNKDIGEALIISENTVKTHVRNILAKYEVTNRAELISLMLKNKSN